MRLILASHSVGRAHLLESAGIAFEQIPSNIDESPCRENETFEDYVQRLSAEKAAHLAQKYPEAFILGADTLLEFDGALIGKPRDLEHAVSIIGRLAGHTHRVLSGFTLAPPGGDEVLSAVDTANVTFHHLAQDRIETYVQKSKPLAFAGAYALQGDGAELVDRIEGEASTIIGMPMHLVQAALNRFGFYSSKAE